MRGLAARGVKYDSNVCLYLQPDLAPLHHWTGIVRFPVFWEDDIHWLRGGAWTSPAMRSCFSRRG